MGRDGVPNAMVEAYSGGDDDRIDRVQLAHAARDRVGAGVPVG
jgi:hypothetical protein